MSGTIYRFPQLCCVLVNVPKGKKSLKNLWYFFISPLLIQSPKCLHVSSQVLKILDFQEAKCHLPHHHMRHFAPSWWCGKWQFASWKSNILNTWLLTCKTFWDCINSGLRKTIPKCIFPLTGPTSITGQQSTRAMFGQYHNHISVWWSSDVLKLWSSQPLFYWF